MTLEFLFWFCLAILFYCYIGYGLLLYVINGLGRKKKRTTGPPYQPPVTLVIPAYREAAVLYNKLENTFSQQYPAAQLNVLVVTDDPDDGTLQILEQFPQVQVLTSADRQGKAAALNRAVQAVQTPIVIFTDADSLLNKEAVQKLVQHFEDVTVGGVGGEKKIGAGQSPVGRAEGLYWQYEAVMKKLDADFYTVLAAGELLAMRTPLYPMLDANLILDDLYLSMHIGMQGYTVAYEPGAYATEAPTISLREEAKRKTRIAAGAFQAIEKLSLRRLLRYPKMAFQYVSRRWLRWVVCPLFIIAVLVINCLLVYKQTGSMYVILLWLQVLFYALAFAGWLLIKNKKVIALATVPFYFLFMNFCMLKGMYHYLARRHTALWQKAKKEGPLY